MKRTIAFLASSLHSFCPPLPKPHRFCADIEAGARDAIVPGDLEAAAGVDDRKRQDSSRAFADRRLLPHSIPEFPDRVEKARRDGSGLHAKSRQGCPQHGRSLCIARAKLQGEITQDGRTGRTARTDGQGCRTEIMHNHAKGRIARPIRRLTGPSFRYSTAGGTRAAASTCLVSTAAPRLPTGEKGCPNNGQRELLRYFQWDRNQIRQELTHRPA